MAPSGRIHKSPFIARRQVSVFSDGGVDVDSKQEEQPAAGAPEPVIEESSAEKQEVVNDASKDEDANEDKPIEMSPTEGESAAEEISVEESSEEKQEVMNDASEDEEANEDKLIEMSSTEGESASEEISAEQESSEEDKPQQPRRRIQRERHTLFVGNLPFGTFVISVLNGGS